MNIVLLYALCFVLLFSLVLFAAVYHEGQYGSVIVGAFLCRIAAAVMFPRLVGRDDIRDYQPVFSEFVNSLDSGSILSFIGEGTQFYTVIFPGWVFTVLGPDSYFVIRLFNAILSVAVIIPLNMITEEVWNRELTRWQVLIILFWPSFLMLSVDVGRTALGVFLPLMSVAAGIRYFNDPSDINLFGLLVITTVLNAANRIHYLFYFVMFVVGIYIYKATYQSSKKLDAVIFATSGIFAGIAIFVYNRLFISVLSVDTIRGYARAQAKGGSVYLPELYPSTILDLFWYLPVQAFYFLFSPLPWDILKIGSLLAIVAGFQSMTLLALTALALLYRTDKVIVDWRIVALFITIVLTAAGFGAVTKNAGAAVRWRLPSVLLLLTISSNLLHQNRHSSEVATQGNSKKYEG